MLIETDPVRNSHKARSVGRSRTGGQAPFQLAPAEALTSTCDRYWRFTNQTVPSERAVPIWTSELEWFLAALAKLAEYPTDLTSLPYADVAYPFAVRPAGTTMLLLLIKRNIQGSELWVERWASRRRDEKSPNGVQFSTYWYRDFRFGTFSQIKVNLRTGWQDSFRDFLTNHRARLADELSRGWTTFALRQKELSREMPPLDRITVARSGANSIRRTPWYAFCPDATEARVLEHSLRRTLLDACNTPTTIPDVAQRIRNALDERAIREQLSWTIRYEDETLTSGYFFGIIRQVQEDRFVATRAQPGFLADPLLTALAKIEPTGSSELPFGPSPQSPSGLPLSRLRDGKLIDGFLTSAFGRFPQPSRDRVRATRAAAAASTRLRQERWKMLQLLDLESAAQATFPDVDALNAVLKLQRLALLRHDNLAFFLAEQSENPAIARVLEIAAKRHNSIIRGEVLPSFLRRSKDMPRPN
jgi:hypothetical protein